MTDQLEKEFEDKTKKFDNVPDVLAELEGLVDRYIGEPRVREEFMSRLRYVNEACERLLARYIERGKKIVEMLDTIETSEKK